MNTLYNLREWIHECERFLFLAEVHYHKEDVIPSHHQFACKMNGTMLESMLSEAGDVYKDPSHCVSFPTCLSPEELRLLKEALDNVCREDWKILGIEKILESQRILHKLGQAVDKDIMQTYESKGCPSFYKICGIRYS